MMGSRASFAFFFFQAEDGIRDLIVTGVQTCALPISRTSQAVPAGRGAGRAGLEPGPGRAGDVRAAGGAADSGADVLPRFPGRGLAAEIGRASCRERV